MHQPQQEPTGQSEALSPAERWVTSSDSTLPGSAAAGLCNRFADLVSDPSIPLNLLEQALTFLESVSQRSETSALQYDSRTVAILPGDDACATSIMQSTVKLMLAAVHVWNRVHPEGSYRLQPLWLPFGRDLTNIYGSRNGLTIEAYNALRECSFCIAGATRTEPQVDGAEPSLTSLRKKIAQAIFVKRTTPKSQRLKTTYFLPEESATVCSIGLGSELPRFFLSAEDAKALVASASGNEERGMKRMVEGIGGEGASIHFSVACPTRIRQRLRDEITSLPHDQRPTRAIIGAKYNLLDAHQAAAAEAGRFLTDEFGMTVNTSIIDRFAYQVGSGADVPPFMVTSLTGMLTLQGIFRALDDVFTEYGTEDYIGQEEISYDPENRTVTMPVNLPRREFYYPATSQDGYFGGASVSPAEIRAFFARLATTEALDEIIERDDIQHFIAAVHHRDIDDAVINFARFDVQAIKDFAQAVMQSVPTGTLIILDEPEIPSFAHWASIMKAEIAAAGREFEAISLDELAYRLVALPKDQADTQPTEDDTATMKEVFVLPEMPGDIASDLAAVIMKDPSVTSCNEVGVDGQVTATVPHGTFASRESTATGGSLSAIRSVLELMYAMELNGPAGLLQGAVDSFLQDYFSETGKPDVYAIESALIAVLYEKAGLPLSLKI